MTLRAIAATLGVQPVTVYRRLKANGIDVATLRDSNGNITTEGASLIASMFDGVPDDTAIQAAISETSQGVAGETSQADIALQVTAAVTAAKLEAAEDRIKALETEVDRLRGERDRLLTMLETEQRQRQQLLTDGRQRRGIFSFFFRGGGE